MQSDKWNHIVKQQQRLKRICRRCGVRFSPKGKYTYFCPDCLILKARNRKKNRPKKYFRKKNYKGKK
jgi:tRNA(Ile2) C34 agmatinyltransferase TiaS